MHDLILIFFIMPILVAYAQYLKDTRLKAQQYVDQLNDTRNHSIRTSQSSLRGFRQDWYEYEEEYLCNWERG